MSKAEKNRLATERQERLNKERTIVATGKCPQCGCGIRRNLALAGWFQCKQLGAVGFRRPADFNICWPFSFAL